MHVHVVFEFLFGLVDNGVVGLVGVDAGRTVNQALNVSLQGVRKAAWFDVALGGDVSVELNEDLNGRMGSVLTVPICVDTLDGWQ